MKNYIITVNGTSYDVTVEEVQGKKQDVGDRNVSKSKPVFEKRVEEKKEETGRVVIKAGAAGKVFKIEKSLGEMVQKGEAVVVLEAMKMEIPVVATEEGTIAGIHINVGDTVEAGATLVTLD